ncbi:MAG: hypothetical protein GAK40_00202 [Burkholderia plantarii]|nr:MAG: hypothetical protein GAK40_00202 [Burkholderia plantarii]
MREISSSIVFELPPGETVPMKVVRSTRLTVQGATVWVTRSHDTGDYFLASGDTLRLRRGERLWLATEGPAAASVAFSVVATPHEAVRSWFTRAVARLADRVHDGWRAV